jgi:hypothetical protein
MVPQQMHPQQMVPVMHPGMQYPAPAYQLNYMMPGYLTVPEVRQPGESIWNVLAREVARGLFKSAGHTVSHFMDTHPFMEPPKG